MGAKRSSCVEGILLARDRALFGRQKRKSRRVSTGNISAGVFGGDKFELVWKVNWNGMKLHL